MDASGATAAAAAAAAVSFEDVAETHADLAALRQALLLAAEEPRALVEAALAKHLADRVAKFYAKVAEGAPWFLVETLLDVCLDALGGGDCVVAYEAAVASSSAPPRAFLDAVFNRYVAACGGSVVAAYEAAAAASSTGAAQPPPTRLSCAIFAKYVAIHGGNLATSLQGVARRSPLPEAMLNAIVAAMAPADADVALAWLCRWGEADMVKRLLVKTTAAGRRRALEQSPHWPAYIVRFDDCKRIVAKMDGMQA